MRATRPPLHDKALSAPALLALALLAAALACTDETTKLVQPPPDPTPTLLGPDDDPPAVVVAIEAVTGGSGPGGALVPGDRPVVRYRLEKADGTPWLLAEMESGHALVSGPTSNYQRVVPLVEDVAEASVPAGGAAHVLVLPELPATYPPPYNDTPAFGPDHGELAGEPLRDGTYTVGLSFAWRYTVEGEEGSFLQVGEATADVLVGGGAGALAPRRVAGQANCERCHVELRAHGGRYRDLVVCLLCHTSGAEDRNDPALAGGTPGVTIDSRVLFHRIHDGAHLPSVVGVAVDEDGALDHAAEPSPYLVAGADGVRDFSEVGFPVWPNRTLGLPKGILHAALDDEGRAREDRIRTGVTSCFVCHLDPDGDGPVEAPAQGALVFAQPSRKACGACHDDVDFTKPYQGDTYGPMPPQPDDAGCVACHLDLELGNPIGIEEAHRHPLLDPSFDPGLEAELLGVADSGPGADLDGALEPGERIGVAFTLQDGDGALADPAELDEVRAVVSGPSGNANLVLATTIAPAALGGPKPLYALELPARQWLEHVGASTPAGGEAFATALTPHHHVPGAETVVEVRVGLGAGATTLAASAAAGANVLEVAGTAGFERGDAVVVDDGTPAEEVVRIQHVEPGRLWLSSPATPDFPPALRSAHPAGASVLEVVLEPRVDGVHWTLDPATGVVTELAELGTGDVLVTYTAPFVVPERYPTPLHGSPEVGAEVGEWSGLPLVDGTYRVTLWASRTRTWTELGVATDYRVASEAAHADVLVGDALAPEPYALLDALDACHACHQDVRFHGGRDRGAAACLACHGSAGSEDLPPYVAAGAPATPGTLVSFRELLHRVHHARLLHDPAFEVVAEGPEPWPDNFAVQSYASILFPAWPGATRNCATCHGAESTAWLAPAPRDHPGGQAVPTAAWRAVCVACHDAPDAVAHVEASTSPAGVESCGVCHGPGGPQAVERVHRPR